MLECFAQRGFVRDAGAVGCHTWAQNFYEGLSAAQSGDYATALREWQPLAEQGDADSQYNLGVMYTLGEGVIQDNVYAHMWFNIAAFLGGKNAVEDRKRIGDKMTQEDVS